MKIIVSLYSRGELTLIVTFNVNKLCFNEVEVNSMARNLTSQLSLHELPKDQWRHPGTTVEQTYEIENIS